MISNRTANNVRSTPAWDTTPAEDGSWVGQARSFDLEQYCEQDNNKIWGVRKDINAYSVRNSGYSYSTILGYCQSLNYQAINTARQNAVFENQQSTSNSNSIASISNQGTKAYNEQVLGLKYNESGAIENPFAKPATEAAPAEDTSLKCLDGSNPDANGCCAGETYTDMGEQGFNCCPDTGGDCFPPIL